MEGSTGQTRSPGISVIVPVYNVRDYVIRCIESILHQSFEHYEVIVVDDGSMDDSVNLLEEYLDKHDENRSRVHIVHQSNQGLSEARNTGLRYAAGEYIWFCDSDDAIEEDCLGRLYEQAHQDQLDLLVFDEYVVDADGSAGPFFGGRGSKLDRNIVTGTELFNQMRQQKCYSAQACGYVINRQFLADTKLQFKKGILHEDEMYTPVLMAMAKKVRYIPECPYIKYERENSITTGNNRDRRLEGTAEVIKGLADYRSSLAGVDRDLFDDNIIGLIRNYLGEYSGIPEPDVNLKAYTGNILRLVRKNRWKLGASFWLYCLYNKVTSLIRK